MMISLGSLHSGLAATPPPPACPGWTPQQGSTDPAVFVQDPGYITRLNITGYCDQADRVNANVADVGRSDFVGINMPALQAWEAACEATMNPTSPTYGQPCPPQNFWTGVNPADNLTNFIGRSDPLPILCGKGGDVHPCTDADMFKPNAAFLMCLGSHENAANGYCAADGTWITTGPPGAATPYVPPPATGSAYGQVTVQPTQSQVGISPQGSAPAAGKSGGTLPTNGTGFSLPTFFTDSTIVSSVPNWALLAGVGAALFILPSLMKGKR